MISNRPSKKTDMTNGNLGDNLMFIVTQTGSSQSAGGSKQNGPVGAESKEYVVFKGTLEMNRDSRSTFVKDLVKATSTGNDLLGLKVQRHLVEKTLGPIAIAAKRLLGDRLQQLFLTDHSFRYVTYPNYNALPSESTAKKKVEDAQKMFSEVNGSTEESNKWLSRQCY